MKLYIKFIILCIIFALNNSCATSNINIPIPPQQDTYVLSNIFYAKTILDNQNIPCYVFNEPVSDINHITWLKYKIDNEEYFYRPGEGSTQDNVDVPDNPEHLTYTGPLVNFAYNGCLVYATAQYTKDEKDKNIIWCAIIRVDQPDGEGHAIEVHETINNKIYVVENGGIEFGSVSLTELAKTHDSALHDPERISHVLSFDYQNAEFLFEHGNY